jgi:hypothetical protein
MRGGMGVCGRAGDRGMLQALGGGDVYTNSDRD